MPENDSSSMNPEEARHNAYFYFIEAVATLAAEPATQCERMGDYNVAWEIKDGVLAGRYLAEWNLLRPQQREAILGLAKALDCLPAGALDGGHGREVNLRAMRNVAWIPLRTQAAEALAIFDAMTKINTDYFARNAT
ncbi:hypothetical protein [Variovorax saccharolyticus]|uniref:hypothetical protein n=1 Tax=Variovorax saccharolyticus TaxID=3053516 RepID=UPI002578CDB8|nr:hypothetical protein [Variovorax sp. J31P216]MDM0026406.1 hypothetical protein [Variovorax sp. J31P216]